jgi:hypothetical protein
MQVTSIQEIRNNLPGWILFINTESAKNNVENGPATTESVNNCWIPWCNDESDFAAHHIEIIDYKSTNTVLWYIWQHEDIDGDFVRISNNGYETPGSTIDGLIDTGSSWNLEINPGGVHANPPAAT